MLDTAKIYYVTTATEARQHATQLARQPVLGLDIETTGLDPLTDQIRLVQAAALDGYTAIFDLWHVSIADLYPLLAAKWCCFNASFEYRFLSKAGLLTQTLDTGCTGRQFEFHDLQLLDRLHTHKMHRSLADAIEDSLQIDLDKELQTSDWGAAELSEQQIEYAALDALATVRAARQLLPMIDRAGQRRLYDVWRQALPVLADLSLRGQSFDWTAHEQLIQHWQQEHDQLILQLREHLGAGINFNSGPQLGEWLRQHLPERSLQHWPRTPTGRLKTDGDSLSLFADLPAVQPLLRYKAVSKLLSTYGVNYARHRHPITGKLHPDFSIGQTVSGRVCASKPNTQNPPRLPEFRALFWADPGKVLIGADFSQIELRVAALLSNDRSMIDAYRRGDDLHTLTAAAVAGIDTGSVTKEQRTAAKPVNFGNLYGQSPAGLVRKAKLEYNIDMTAKQARQAQWQFHAVYPQMAAWKRQQAALAQQFRQVKTKLGLIRDFDIQGAGFLKGEACNIPIQGSAAELLHGALARLPAALAGLDAELYHNVHDELILQADPAQAEAAAQALKGAMLEGFLDVFPQGEAVTAGLVDVQIGPNWAGVH